MSKPVSQDDAQAPLFSEQDVLCRTFYQDREQLLEAMIRRIEHPAFGYFSPSDEYYQAIIS